jgi:hypothetical protein
VINPAACHPSKVRIGGLFFELGSDRRTGLGELAEHARRIDFVAFGSPRGLGTGVLNDLQEAYLSGSNNGLGATTGI